MTLECDAKFEEKLTWGIWQFFFFEWCKIWNRIVLPFQNWHEKFNKFWPEHSKISKICSLMGWFWPKYIMLQLKKVQSSYVWLHSRLTQSLKENWLVLPKIAMRNLANFEQSTWIGTLVASFCLTLKMYELEIYRGVMCHDNEKWCKSWRGIDLSVQNWHEEFDKF